jgi:putative hydrolase of the HAD superfamily
VFPKGGRRAVSRLGCLEAVLFDVGGTLIECHPAPPEIYARALSRKGPRVTAGEVAPVYRQVWSELTQVHPLGSDRYNVLKGGEWEWWGEFLRRVLARLQHPAPWEPLLTELFEVFSEPSMWRTFPEVPEVLGSVRGRGLKLAIVSNWDSRLPALLERLGLFVYFDAVLVSAVEGLEKPAPEIFRRAAKRLNVTAESCLHVGDSPLDDYRGSESAGMLPVLVDRHGIFGNGYRCVADLRGVNEFI